MSRIFISYRRTDSPSEAGRIYDYLEPHFGRESIFKDVYAIDAGDNFRDRINQAVGQCQVLLAVMGKNWLQATDAKGNRRLDNAADWVRLEIETALNRKVRVIPILLDGVEMPSTHELPITLQPLADINAAHVRHDPDFRGDMERVLKVIGRDIANSFFFSGYEKYEIKNYQGAIADYNKALELNPDNVAAYNNRGLAKSALGNHQGAVDDYDQALKLNPNHADTYGNLGNAKHTLGDKLGAIAAYNQALLLNPSYAYAYVGRGLAKSALGDKIGAIMDYNQALLLNPNDVSTYFNSGLARAELGDKMGAINDYNQALKLNPGYAFAYFNRGLCKSLLGDKMGAIADYLEAARLHQQQGNTEYYNATLNALTQLGGSL